MAGGVLCAVPVCLVDGLPSALALALTPGARKWSSVSVVVASCTMLCLCSADHEAPPLFEESSTSTGTGRHAWPYINVVKCGGVMSVRATHWCTVRTAKEEEAVKCALDLAQVWRKSRRLSSPEASFMRIAEKAGRKHRATNLVQDSSERLEIGPQEQSDSIWLGMDSGHLMIMH